MTKAQIITHVTQLYKAQQKKRAKDVVVDATVVIDEQEAATTAEKVQAGASTKAADNTNVCGVIIDLTNTSVMDETGEASNVDEVEPLIPDLASKLLEIGGET